MELNKILKTHAENLAAAWEEDSYAKIEQGILKSTEEADKNIKQLFIDLINDSDLTNEQKIDLIGKVSEL